MKKTLLFLLMLSVTSFLSAQVTVFSDNFESGTSNWSLTSTWGLSTASSHSTSHSLTESPTGNYGNNLNYVTATLSSGVNLSTALSANLSFWAKYSIEGGFDYMYLDVSSNGGTSWVNIASYDDTLNNWTQFNYSLGGYVGNSNVKIRFRFYSDGAVNYDGMYIDDVVITSDTVDNAAPLVLHTPPVFYKGVFLADTMIADIIDISGVQTAELKYSVDGNTYTTINGVNTTGNTYQFIIPQQPAGAMVDYFFRAVDSASTPNTEITDTFSYISGNYIAYDNGQVDFVDSTGSGESVAVRITLSGTSSLKGMLIRNYTDVNRSNDSMIVHVWTNNQGVPGTDIITPFKVKPAATLQNTSAMTVIDLRPYSAQLSNLTGDIFIGFSVGPGIGVWSTITSPGVTTRSFLKTSTSSWTAATSGTSGSSDFHFRAITAPYCPTFNVGFQIDTTLSPIVSFTDTTNPAASSWSWNFGDGNNSNLQNPVHSYTAYGTYTVTLAAGNSTCGINDTATSTFTLIAKAPMAKFVYDTTLTPAIFFTDSSQFAPSQWLWDFDDNGATATTQNAAHTFPAAGGTFHVCLTATNSAGSDTYCENLVIMSSIGIQENAKDMRSEIFPNPMQSTAFIILEGVNTNTLKFKLYDLQGRRVNMNYQIKNNGIELFRGNVARGQYIYEIYNNTTKIQTGRLIVQ